MFQGRLGSVSETPYNPTPDFWHWCGLPGEEGVACLVGVQEAFIPTVGAAVEEMHVFRSGGLTIQYDPGMAAGPAAQARNASSTPGNGGHACGCFPGKGRREEERAGEQPAAGHCCS